MNDRVVDDFSVKINFGEKEELVNRVYDHVHIYEWLGHGILKLVTTGGVEQWHLPQDQALWIAESAGITPIYEQTITSTEYETYLRYQETFLTDDWLGGDM